MHAKHAAHADVEKTEQAAGGLGGGPLLGRSGASERGASERGASERGASERMRPHERYGHDQPDALGALRIGDARALVMRVRW